MDKYAMPGLLESPSAGLFEDARQILGNTATCQRVLDMEYAAQDKMNHGIDELRRQGSLAGSPCKKGCAWCCHEQVVVLPPALMAIREYLAARPASVRKTIHRRVAELYAQKQRMTPDECHWTAMACPFLVENTCRIYPVRTYHCRGVLSASEELCRHAFEQPQTDITVPLLSDAYALATGIMESVQAALQAAGLSFEPLELVSAYHIMMTQPDAIKRWLAGENPFAPAALARWRPKPDEDQEEESSFDMLSELLRER